MSHCRICVPIVAKNKETAWKDIKEAQQLGADVVELRLDYLENMMDWKEVVQHCPLPKIVTCRPTWEGGFYAADESSRLSILAEACAMNCEFVDVECKAMAHFQKPCSHTKLIISQHNYERAFTQQEVSQIYSQMLSFQADIVKIACHIDDIVQCEVLFQLLSACKVPCIALGMGPAGQVSRILAGRYGAFLTFACLHEGKASADGQIAIKELLDMYRFRSVDLSTRLYGVLGYPIAHSMSPAIHNTAFSLLSLHCVYCPLLVQDLDNSLMILKKWGFYGFSVTIPHKESAKRHVEEIESLAQEIGAINTMVKEEPTGRWKGYNTDCFAAIDAIQEGLKKRQENGYQKKKNNVVQHSKVLLIGAGGAARAIGFGLRQHGFSIWIVNRNYERAQRLAAELNAQVLPWEALSSFLMEGTKPVDVIINSTSIGMYPQVDTSPIDVACLKQLERKPLVFDVVYNPTPTKLLREAESVGCPIVTGIDMFVRQAVQQFELWTQEKAPIQAMRQVVINKLMTVRP